MLFLVLETNLKKNVKREKDIKKHMIINKKKIKLIRLVNSWIRE